MSNTRIVFLLVIMSGLLLTAACVDHQNINETTSSDSETQGSDEKITQIIDVCEPLNVSGVVFPRQEYVEGPREMMAAELIGKLELVDGYLQVDSLYGDGRIIPVWPAEYTLAYEDYVLTIFDGDGNPLIRVGEEVYMGGGEGYGSGLLECVRQQLPDSYKGKFWYVGDGVRPNLPQDSELVQFEVITGAERTAILLHKQPILDEWIEEPSVTTGILRFYFPHRCPRIKSESGLTDYLPIWPPDYSLQMVDGLVEIRNASGELVAREGEEVVLQGGGPPHSWDSEQYRQLHYNTPGDCFGPYWIVSQTNKSP